MTSSQRGGGPVRPRSRAAGDGARVGGSTVEAAPPDVDLHLPPAQWTCAPDRPGFLNCRPGNPRARRRPQWILYVPSWARRPSGWFPSIFACFPVRERPRFQAFTRPVEFSGGEGKGVGSGGGGNSAARRDGMVVPIGRWRGRCGPDMRADPLCCRPAVARVPPGSGAGQGPRGSAAPPISYEVPTAGVCRDHTRKEPQVGGVSGAGRPPRGGCGRRTAPAVAGRRSSGPRGRPARGPRRGMSGSSAFSRPRGRGFTPFEVGLK